MNFDRLVERFRGTRLGKALFWAFASFTLVMALLPHPPRIPGNPSDKIQHILAFAVLGAVGAVAFSRTKAIRLIVALSLFGAAIEVLQAIPVLHRDSDPLDWLADTIACIVTVRAMRWWLGHKR